MQQPYDCFVGAPVLQGRGRTRTTSQHRRAKRSDLSASCYEEAKRSDLSRWLMEASCKQAAPETNLYFYHPDHLGSSSFITDATGYAVQHLQPACRSFGAGRYLPFGETFVDQQNGYDSRYTFSAKEKDDETQYSYFGARYYDSDLSVWLSVDPMAGKYPNSSPYLYCENNPVVYVDPNGEFKTWAGALSFSLIHGGKIHTAKYGDYAGQYYVMKEMAGNRMTKHGLLASKSKSENVAYIIGLDMVGIHTKVSFGWGDGNGSPTRSLFERAFDFAWDALLPPYFYVVYDVFESVDNMLKERNEPAVNTSDPYPAQAPKICRWVDLLEGNMNPNVSDKNYDDKADFKKNDPNRTQNRPENKSKVDSTDMPGDWREDGEIKGTYTRRWAKDRSGYRDIDKKRVQ